MHISTVPDSTWGWGTGRISQGNRPVGERGNWADGHLARRWERQNHPYRTVTGTTTPSTKHRVSRVKESPTSHTGLSGARYGSAYAFAVAWSIATAAGRSTFSSKMYVPHG